MKKYIKPSIEVVQTTLTADFLLGASNGEGYNEKLSKGSSSSWDDEDDDNFE